MSVSSNEVLVMARPNSILLRVPQLTLRSRCDLSTTRRQLKTNADKTGNEGQRRDGAGYVRPKTATTAESVYRTWGKSPPKCTVLRMTRCRFLRGKGHQSCVLP